MDNVLVKRTPLDVGATLVNRRHSVTSRLRPWTKENQRRGGEEEGDVLLVSAFNSGKKEI